MPARPTSAPAAPVPRGKTRKKGRPEAPSRAAADADSAEASPTATPPAPPASSPAATPPATKSEPPAAAPPTPRAPGHLQVTAIPWAEIFIDGKLVSEMPSAGVPVPPGVRRVRLRNTDRGYDRTFDVRVVSGEKKRFVREVGGN